MKRGMVEILVAAIAVGLILVGMTVPQDGPLAVATAVVTMAAIAWLLAARLMAAREMEARGDASAKKVASLTGMLNDSAAALSDLEKRIADQRASVERAEQSVKGLTDAFAELESNVETLSSAAQQSASSILEMTTNNEEVAENMTAMGISVRDTVNSIGQMAKSVKEVAANVDELSTTAEETSSAMNQMDVSINQVQTNANETAIISEGVARDAERSADAVAKTIGVIKEAKKSSQEAMDVIQNLGKKIEAIGQILNVIDDVAEQTNLLALNAAIIAALAMMAAFRASRLV